MSSDCEAARSGSEELKKCPAPSSAVLWFVNVIKRKNQAEKKNNNKLQDFLKLKVVSLFLFRI